uniref:Uncharacterized protein n=1 Tax=Octopus bimaculoides TaxID=37653 RepID=A0A0L8I0F7_OCTBM
MHMCVYICLLNQVKSRLIKKYQVVIFEMPYFSSRVQITPTIVLTFRSQRFDKSNNNNILEGACLCECVSVV